MTERDARLTARTADSSASLIGREPNGGDVGGDIINVRLNVSINSPHGGAVIAGPAGGVPVTVRGSASCMVDFEEAAVDKVEVRLGDGGTYVTATPTGPDGGWSSWSFERNVNTTGPLNISARASVTVDRLRTASDSVSVTVQFDTTPPELTINPLPNGGKVTGDSEKIRTTVTGTASDTQTGIAWITCDVDGVGFPVAQTAPNWRADCDIPHGLHTITVRAADGAGQVSTRQVQVEALDNTAPTLIIDEPPDFFTKLAEDETGAWITISGTATDTQSGVAVVEWSLDKEEGPYSRVTPQPNWSSWSARVKVPTDFHNIIVRARDNKNNVSTRKKPVRVSQSFKPGDQEDNVSPLAYLRDLIEFARSHVTVTPTGAQPRPLKLEDLTREFFQPFGDLTSAEQVRQLRVCIEVLRSMFPASPTDAVAYWPFNEGTGNTAADVSGNALAGTLQGGATWGPGRVGAKALSFDGVDDYVQVGAAAKLKMTDFLSISAWIYPKGPGSSANEGGVIVNKEGEYEVARFSDGTIRWAFANANPGWVWTDTRHVAPLNQWTHLAIVYDRGAVTTYANGRSMHTYAGSGPVADIDTASNDFRIGGRQTGASQFFHGIIDEVRVFNRPLKAREVATLATPAARLVAHWKFDEGSGTTTADGSGNGNVGTLGTLLATTQPGPTWVNGKVGAKALAFDGADDVVKVNRQASIKDTVNDFTVAFWANPQSPLGRIDAESTQGTSGTEKQRYAIDPYHGASVYGSPEHACAGVSVGTDAIGVYEHTSDYMPALLVHQANISGWTHIAVVYQDKRPRLYVNGTLTKTGLRSPKSFVHVNPATLGGMGYGFFHGQLDDVRIYDQALSARDVADLAGVLRQDAPTPTEADYRQVAYQTLLNRLGTSYEEIRLVRQADAGTRKALADRLGIDSDAARADRLDRLLLQPSQVTEAELERLFGLADTKRDPLVARPIPDMLAWRLEHLRTLWKEQDHPIGQAADTLPIIDPDLVRQEDLIPSTSSKPNPAFNLWQARSTWVRDLLLRLTNDRRTGESVMDRLERLVGTTKLAPMAELLALDAQRQQGKDIEPELKNKRLSVGAFSYLMRAHKLAAAGTLLDAEWSDVYSILVQVEKLHKYNDWRIEEANLTLSPDYFVLPSGGTTATPSSPRLPAWRATERERRAWQNKLRARADQELAVAQGLQAVVDSTEEATLPLLRDALVASVGVPIADGSQGVGDTFNRLTDWLQIDVRSTGRRKTTRINQAIETIHGILFSLRTNRFKDVETELDIVSVNPRPDWKLAVNASDFDQEWAWMGSFVTWRAAMLVFLYPENLLLPSLRGVLTQDFKIEQRSESFKTMVEDLRGQQSLTPDSARRRANEYLARLRTGPLAGVLPDELKAPFEITEQLNEAQLRVRKTQVMDMFGKYAAPDKKSQLFYVREAFYFVPIQVALQLQRSRQYTAALDWFRTVYAYDLPVDQRKIYHGLVLESGIKSSYERVLTKWLLGNDLNPHLIAANRANAYTRFTLLYMVRCFLDFADAEFTSETDESTSRARALYLSALELLGLNELRPPKDAGFAPNPVVEALRLHAELNLFKLRDNRNIAGMQRQIETPPPTRMINSLPTVGGGGQLALPGVRPTPYRYSTLVERAKHLVALAQQIEAAYLSALEKTGAEGYTELRARQDLDLAKAGVDLQNLRAAEANGGVGLARLQQERSQFQADYYSELITEGTSALEIASLAQYGLVAGLQLASAAVSYASAFMPASISVGFPGGVSASVSPQGSAGAIASSLSSTAAALSTTASITATLASYERREQEWRFQRNLAQRDAAIGAQQITSAQDRLNVVNQELSIARTQDINADAAVNFLTTGRFATAELYEWMSGILGRVYGYFLQQATAMARLAQSQLAFERQEEMLSVIQSDYWQPPSENETAVNGNNGEGPDRRGITGSTRLLQDVYQLDQYAFETDKRKLQLTKTISLVRTAPLEFQRFRESGVLPFATPMEMFDRDFPGHYLRLIKRVQTSIVALVPPIQGIRATLAATGSSRVTTSADSIFQTVPLYREPELVVLSSPNNATGVFELDQQSDMLMPFEAMGVDTSWELQMPKASNPFDYRTIADVLITIEYTALNSFDYRQQIIRELDRAISADHPLSLRQQFPDQWYDLHNPDLTATPMTVSFDTRREDFPPNIEDVSISHLVLYIVRSDEKPFTQPLTAQLFFTPKGGTESGGAASSADGVFSTRRGNANEWLTRISNRVPEGSWRLTLPNTQEVKDLFENEKIEDILLVITYSGVTPEWPD